MPSKTTASSAASRAGATKPAKKRTATKPAAKPAPRARTVAKPRVAKPSVAKPKANGSAKSTGAAKANGASKANGDAAKAPATSAAAAPPPTNGVTRPTMPPAPSNPLPPPVRVSPVTPQPSFGIRRPPSISPLAAQIPPMPPAPHVTFKVGDKAVHPAHGVGEVTAIEQRDIGGSKQMFYVLRILDNGMKVMVPTAATSQVGLRGIMSEKEANDILSTMRAREVAVDVQPWSRRFRVYTEMIKSGSPVEVAKVLRDMNRLKFDKDLSFGERRLLDQARSLLLKELAFAKKKTEADMAEEIRTIFSA